MQDQNKGRESQMPEQSLAAPDLTGWQAETLRLTAFTSPAIDLGQQNWWAELVGETPETTVSRAKGGERHEEGRFESGKLVLRIQPARVDWMLVPLVDPEKELESIPTMGTFSDSLKSFMPLMSRWLQSAPRSQRLAFGAILMQPVQDRAMGYRQINAYLPFRLDSETSSDFFYQINRPRDSTSGIPGLRINRLGRWSVAYFQGVRMTISPAARGVAPVEEHHACRLELDINTAADFQAEFSGEQLAAIFRELVDLGKEIAEKGDIP